jgi:hypothetical protein
MDSMLSVAELRALARAGILESVAMKISGHKTGSVLERHNIVRERDISGAATEIEAFRATCSQIAHNQALSANHQKRGKCF